MKEICWEADQKDRLNLSPSPNGNGRVGGIQIADERGIILQTDLAFDSLFGYERGSLIGKHVSILTAYSQEVSTQKIRKIFQSLETDGVWHGDLFNRRKDGKGILTLCRMVPCRFGGSKYWLAIVKALAETNTNQPQENLETGLSLDRLVRNISTKFTRLEPHKIDQGIHQALQMLREFVQADRCYLCLAFEKKGGIEEVYESCARGVEPRWSQLKGLSLSHLPWKFNIFNQLRKNPLFSDRIRAGDSQAGPERAIQTEDHPVLLIPIFYRKLSVGILGFDFPREKENWPEDKIAKLRMAGEMLINALERKRTQEELQETKLRYQSLVENLDDGIFSLDKEGRFTSLSPGIMQLTSYKPEEMLEQPLSRFVYQEDLIDFQLSLQRNMLIRKESFQLRLVDKNGHIRNVRISIRPLIHEEELVGWTGVLSDITAQKWAEILLRRTEEKYRGLFENAVEGIFQCTLDGYFILANPACARILGYDSLEEMEAQDSEKKRLSFVEPEHYQEFQRLLREQGVVQKYEVQVSRKDRSKIWVSLNALAIRNPNGVPLFFEGRMEDITERKKDEGRVHFLSFHDKLTGLYNRAYFEEEMKRLDTERQLPISLVMGDFNCLKLINDAFGHPEGDKALVQIARILRESCRKEDVIARLGGDEFVIFLPRTNSRACAEILDRIKYSCHQKSSGTTQLSMALGMATKEKSSQDIQEIFREADEKMYKNKLAENRSIRSFLISSMQKTLMVKSPETKEHIHRLKQLASRMGQTIGLPGDKLNDLNLLATLHDIGNVALPEKILNKADHLSLDEWKLIWRHPEIGYRIAESSPQFFSIARSILAHHEKWNGSGYPLGLKGEDIPLLSRILSIADAYDVMTQGRPYKKGMSMQNALQELKSGAGYHFDPKLVEVFLKVLSARK